MTLETIRGRRVNRLSLHPLARAIQKVLYG